MQKDFQRNMHRIELIIHYLAIIQLLVKQKKVNRQQQVVRLSQLDSKPALWAENTVKWKPINPFIVHVQWVHLSDMVIHLVGTAVELSSSSPGAIAIQP